MDAAVLGGLVPYQVEHINRFGDYSLNLERQVPSKQFETILILFEINRLRDTDGRMFWSLLNH